MKKSSKKSGVKQQNMVVQWRYNEILVGGDWNMNFMTFHILGMSSSQLTHILQRV